MGKLYVNFFIYYGRCIGFLHQYVCIKWQNYVPHAVFPTLKIPEFDFFNIVGSFKAYHPCIRYTTIRIIGLLRKHVHTCFYTCSRTTQCVIFCKDKRLILQTKGPCYHGDMYIGVKTSQAHFCFGSTFAWFWQNTHYFQISPLFFACDDIVIKRWLFPRTVQPILLPISLQWQANSTRHISENPFNSSLSRESPKSTTSLKVRSSICQ